MYSFDGFGLFSWAGTAWLILDWVIRILALFIVPRNRKPSSGTAWLMLIFLLPTVGILLYFILGSPKLPQRRREIQKTLDDVIERTVTHLDEGDNAIKVIRTGIPDKYQPVAKLNEALSRLPALAGNKLEVLPDYNPSLDRLVQDINASKHYVHLEYFIIVLDDVTEPIFAAMAQAVQRGVTVRVMYDDFSSRRYKGFKAMLARMRADGVISQPMLPFRLPGKGYVRPDLRNHRKLVVIDGHIGYTGSLNLVQRDYHRKDDIYYDELVVRMEGPIVLELSAVFISDWYSETGARLSYQDLGVHPSDIQPAGKSLAQVLPSGPGYDDENNLLLFTELIHTAQKRITITNPYFVPDEALSTAIISAARRGVEVTMINSEAMDQLLVGHAQRSFYEQLLTAGVKIYLYNAPILLHSKFMTIDDDLATIGSSNMDIRSFFLDLEVTLVSYDPAVVAKLQKIENGYLKRSKQIDLTTWQLRPRHKVLLDNLARLTAALQ